MSVGVSIYKRLNTATKPHYISYNTFWIKKKLHKFVKYLLYHVPKDFGSNDTCGVTDFLICLFKVWCCAKDWIYNTM